MPEETIEINWEAPEEGAANGDGEGAVEIDWGGMDDAIESVEFEVVEDSNITTNINEGEVVAVGKDALTLLGK